MEEIKRYRPYAEHVPYAAAAPMGIAALLLLITAAASLRCSRRGRGRALRRCLPCCAGLVELLLLVAFALCASLVGAGGVAASPELLREFELELNVTDALEEVRGYCVTMPAALLQVSLDLQAAPEALPGHKEQAEWLHVTSAALCVCVEKIVPGIASLAGPALVCMAAIAFAFVVTNGLCCSSSCCNGSVCLEPSALRP